MLIFSFALISWFLVNIVLFGYTAATAATLKCELTEEDDAHHFDVGVGEHTHEFDLQANEYKLYKLEAPEGTVRVTCQSKCF